MNATSLTNKIRKASKNKPLIAMFSLAALSVGSVMTDKPAYVSDTLVYVASLFALQTDKSSKIAGIKAELEKQKSKADPLLVEYYFNQNKNELRAKWTGAVGSLCLALAVGLGILGAPLTFCSILALEGVAGGLIASSHRKSAAAEVLTEVAKTTPDRPEDKKNEATRSDHKL
ncbi:MAG: hypothetical protein PHE27_06700 [Alphaproteobacteria bacterium]|nr:hypothetical protein [Alphaproteobacteria bacterium]